MPKKSTKSKDSAKATATELSEAKKLMPIGTIQVWASGTYQKVNHKTSSDWKKLTSAVKVEPGAPKITYLPGSVLPANLQMFSFNPALNAKGAKGGEEAPAASATSPAPAVPVEAPKKVKAPDILPPEPPSIDKAKEVLKKQEPLEPEKKEISKDTPKDSDKKAEDPKPPEPNKAAAAPEEPKKENPKSIIDALPWQKGGDKNTFESNVTSKDYVLWLQSFALGAAKAGLDSDDVASSLLFFKYLRNNPQVVSSVGDKIGHNWLDKVGNALLIEKANFFSVDTKSSEPQENNYASALLKDTFGPTWLDDLKLLQNGAELGSVPVIKKPADSVTKQEPAQQAAVPPKLVPDAPPEAIKGSTPANQADNKNALDDFTAKLVTFVNKSIEQHGGDKSKTFSDPTFTLSVLKTFGSGWLPKYIAGNAVLNSNNKVSKDIEPIVPPPPAAEPVKNEAPVDVKPTDIKTVALGPPSDEDLNIITNFQAVFPEFFVGGISKEKLKSAAEDLSTYGFIKVKHGNNAYEKFEKAYNNKIKWDAYQMVKDIDDMLVNSGSQSADDSFFIIDKNTDLVKKYGADWLPKYKSAKEELAHIKPNPGVDVSPGSEDALENASIVDFVDKAVVNSYALDVQPQLKQSPGTLVHLIKSDAAKASQMVAKFGPNWPIDLTKAMLAANNAQPALTPTEQELVDYVDSQIGITYNNGDINWINSIIKDHQVVATYAALNKKFGFGNWAGKYKEAKKKQLEYLKNKAKPSVSPQEDKAPATAVPTHSLYLDLTNYIDDTLAKSGVSLAVLSENPAWVAKLTQKYGPNWKENYQLAKGQKQSTVSSTSSTDLATPIAKPNEKSKEETKKAILDFLAVQNPLVHGMYKQGKSIDSLVQDGYPLDIKMGVFGSDWKKYLQPDPSSTQEVTPEKVMAALSTEYPKHTVWLDHAQKKMAAGQHIMGGGSTSQLVKGGGEDSHLKQVLGADWAEKLQTYLDAAKAKPQATQATQATQGPQKSFSDTVIDKLKAQYGKFPDWLKNVTNAIKNKDIVAIDHFIKDNGQVASDMEHNLGADWKAKLIADINKESSAQTTEAPLTLDQWNKYKKLVAFTHGLQQPTHHGDLSHIDSLKKGGLSNNIKHYFGSDWEDQYKEAIKHIPVSLAHTKFVQGPNTTANLVKAVNLALTTINPNTVEQNGLEVLANHPQFKAAMKSMFQQKWLYNYKKAVKENPNLAFKPIKLGVPQPVQQQPKATQNTEFLNKSTHVSNAINQLYHYANEGSWSLQSALEDIATTAYASNPKGWDNEYVPGTTETGPNKVIHFLLSQPKIDSQIKAYFGETELANYKALKGGGDTQTSKYSGGHHFPAAQDLSSAGSASSLGGGKNKIFLKDTHGNKYLFKPAPSDPERAHAGEAASNLASLFYANDPLGTFVPLTTIKHPSAGFGSIQPMVGNVKSTLDGINIATLNKDQLNTLMKERVLDWLLANHDTKPAQFLLTNDGKILGVDKEQAFKLIGQDQLDINYHVVGSKPPIYNDLFNAHVNGSVSLDLKSVLPYIVNIENTSDEDWLAQTKGYVASLGLSKNQQKDLESKILARKNNVRSDFEEFFTKVEKLRGKLKPNEKFEFGTDTYKKPTGPHALPYVNDLSFHSSGNHLGGAGAKSIYTDKNSKKWLFKEAQEKSGSAAKPYAAHVQAGFSKVAVKIKNNHLPIGVSLIDSKIGTIQPLIEPIPPTLSGVEPKTLTPEEKESLAAEHILDWLGSQHDSHGKQFLRHEGKIVGIDKEQGFKYFDFGKGDKLSTTYHPNSIYGEAEPYYNKFWNSWKNNEFTFDPKDLEPYIVSAEKIDPTFYTDAYKPYAETMFKGDASKQKQFLDAILLRKNNVRKDFETFITELYKKKTGSSGVFKFKTGWKEATKESPVQSPEDPSGPVTITKKVKLKANEALQLAKYGGIKLKAYKDPSGAGSDASKVTLKLHMGHPVGMLESFLKDFGIKYDTPIITGPANHVVVVKKADFDKAHAEVEQTEIINPIVPDQSPDPTAFPDIAKHKHPDYNAHELHTVHEEKLPLGGKLFAIGGKAVESHSVKAISFVDNLGKKYIQFTMKLTHDFAVKAAKNGQDATFEFPHATYDTHHGAYKPAGGHVKALSTKKVQIGSSDLHIATESNPYGWQSTAVARVYASEHDTAHDILTKLLNKNTPGLAAQVLNNPTQEEITLLKLRRILWAHAPQVNDKLPANASIDLIKSKLISAGIDDAKINSVKIAQVLDAHKTHILPGRFKTIAEGKPLRFLFNGIQGGADVAYSVIEKGLLGINERAIHGMHLTGGSVPSDEESGSSDGILTRPVTDAGIKGSHILKNHAFAGNYQALISPEEIDRLDAYGYNGDTYGKCNPLDNVWKNRKPLHQLISSSVHHAGAEISFRKGINTGRIIRLVANTQHDRTALINLCKQKGVLEVNNVPIEDFVVICPTIKDAYEKYVKPLGY